MEPQKPYLIKRGSEARQAIFKGVNEVYETVRTTLGPGGRNSFIDRGYRSPRITNDGVTIAQNIILDDEIQNIAAQGFIQAAAQTNKHAGDGTSTSIVIAGKLIQDYFKKLESSTLVDAGANLMDINRKLKDEKEQTIEQLKKKAKKVKNQEELKKIAHVSTEDEELADIISDMVWKTGEDGFVHVDDGYHGTIETEFHNAMKFHGKFAHQIFITNKNRRTMEANNAPVFLTNAKLDNKNDLANVTQATANAGHNKLIVVAHEFTNPILQEIAVTKEKAGFEIYPVRAKSLTTPEWEDVAIFTGATMMNVDKGNKFSEFKTDQLGRVTKMVVSDEDTYVWGGNGDEKKVKERVKQLQDEINVERVHPEQNRIKQRITSLSSNVGTIYVDSPSELEQGYTRLKVEDGICAARAALQEGYVTGAGLPLRELADNDNSALAAPYNQIVENLGGVKPNTKGVYDPLRVVRLAVENAYSVAATIITSESIQAQKKERPEYDGLHEVAEALKQQDNKK